MAGITFYLNGGRYVTTDDAYVGAQKVLITSDVSGKIISVDREGRPAGHDRRHPVPDRSGAVPAGAGAGARQTRRRQDQPRQPCRQREALRTDHRTGQRRHRAQAKGRRAQEFAGQEQGRIAARSRQQRHRPWSPRRRSASWSRNSDPTRSTSCSAIPSCRSKQFPAYMQAKAALDDAQRNLDLTTVRAPMNGIATQVEQIQLGRFVIAGSAGVFGDRRRQPLGRRQSEGIRFHLCGGRPERHARRRRLPQPRVQGHGRLALARHRRAIRDPAAAERHRQFRQGGAARPGADLFRQERQASSAS